VANNKLYFVSVLDDKFEYRLRYMGTIENKAIQVKEDFKAKGYKAFLETKELETESEPINDDAT